MRNIFIASALALMFLSVLIQCETEPIESNEDYISYGYSSGMCEGYCYKSITLSGQEIELLKKGWDLEGALPDLTFSEQIDRKFWDHVYTLIDIRSFSALDSVIGDPDFDNRGAEWIDIKLNNTSHKVIFEYGQEPLEVKKYIELLRTYAAICESNNHCEKLDFNNRVLLYQPANIRLINANTSMAEFLIEIVDNNDTTYYSDRNLSSIYNVDGLNMSFHGILQNELSYILKPEHFDPPKIDFMVRNIKLTDIKPDETTAIISGIDSISYGSKFGLCFGYCYKSITLSSDEINFHIKSWGNDEEYPDVFISENFDFSDWYEIASMINYERFVRLDPIIGCPDCADGGAEWIELSKGSKTHKVVFEFNNPPGFIVPYIQVLRDHLRRFYSQL